MFYPELEGNALKAYEDMCAKLKSKAMKELGLGPDAIILRPLKPTDLGYGVDDWSGMQSGASQAITAGWSSSVIQTTIANGRWVGINGICINEVRGAGTFAPSLLNQIRITREGSDARFWDVEHVSLFEDHTGFADDPVTIDQQTSVTINMYARAAATLYNTQFIGAVAEKRGITINP